MCKPANSQTDRQTDEGKNTASLEEFRKKYNYNRKTRKSKQQTLTKIFKLDGIWWEAVHVDCPCLLTIFGLAVTFDFDVKMQWVYCKCTKAINLVKFPHVIWLRQCVHELQSWTSIRHAWIVNPKTECLRYRSNCGGDVMKPSTLPYNTLGNKTTSKPLGPRSYAGTHSCCVLLTRQHQVPWYVKPCSSRTQQSARHTLEYCVKR